MVQLIVVGCIFLMLTISGIIHGQFVEQPGDATQIGVVNQSLTVSCVLNQTYTYMNWQNDDDKSLSDSSLKIFDKYKLKYELYHGENNDGTYFLKLEIKSLILGEQQVQCTAAGPGSSASQLSKIIVVAPPDDVTCNSSLGKIGEPLTLKCISAGAVPTADLSWTDNEGRYVNGGKTENLIHNIANVSKQDNGKEFTCSARNNATDILQTRPNCTLHLNVTYEPVVTIGSSSVYVVEGDPLWLTCRQLDANPNITKYEWLKKGTKVKGLNASPTSLTARGEIFPKINRTDGGEFTCRGKNSAGWGESNTCHVDVYYGPEGLTCTRENKDRIVEGDEVSFSCTVDSNPRASLKISYFGKMIYHGNRTSFTLPSATCHNKETHIICNAYNEKTEKNIAANISMTFVECQPKIVEHSETMIGSLFGSDVIMDISTLANPAPTWKWYKGNVMQDRSKYKNSSDENIHNCSFLIENMTKSDFGQYTCKITNGVGTVNITFTLQSQDKPLKPSDLIQKSATSVSMLIGFTPGFDGGSTQSFKMNYTEIKNSTNIWSKNSTKREIYIKNLKPGTEYKITLQSSNKYGKSDPISKTFKTKSVPGVEIVSTNWDKGALILKMELEYRNPKSVSHLVIEVCKKDNQWECHVGHKQPAGAPYVIRNISQSFCDAGCTLKLKAYDGSEGEIVQNSSETYSPPDGSTPIIIAVIVTLLVCTAVVGGVIAVCFWMKRNGKAASKASIYMRALPLETLDQPNNVHHGRNNGEYREGNPRSARNNDTDVQVVYTKPQKRTRGKGDKDRKTRTHHTPHPPSVPQKRFEAGNGGYTADETAMGPVYENVAEVKAEADEMPNVEGLIYAELAVARRPSKSTKPDMMPPEPDTVYADIVTFQK